MDSDAQSSGGFSLGRLILNCLTLVVLGATLVVGLIVLSLFINPQTPMNPFPPVTRTRINDRGEGRVVGRRRRRRRPAQ